MKELNLKGIKGNILILGDSGREDFLSKFLESNKEYYDEVHRFEKAEQAEEVVKQAWDEVRHGEASRKRLIVANEFDDSRIVSKGICYNGRRAHMRIVATTRSLSTMPPVFRNIISYVVLGTTLRDAELRRIHELWQPDVSFKKIDYETFKDLHERCKSKGFLALGKTGCTYFIPCETG